MSRRIEVELTSQRDDGTWTWRAAGAKQPKGSLDGTLLYDGASVGDVCRADADFEIDGIFVTSVLPPKGRSGRPDDERIELIGGKNEVAGVTTQLARKGRSDRRKGGGKRNNKGSKRDNTDNRSKSKNRSNKEGERRQRKPKADNPPKPKAKKLKPGRVHRKAFIETLPEEQRVIADQVSRGGIAAVRKEIEAQNQRATQEGGEEVRADALITLAEALLPQLKIAEWRDRADAALETIDDVDIRDLRTVLVAAEDSARDDETRELTEKIRSGLNQRVEKAQIEWQDEIRSALKEERVVRALRLSSRPPKAGSPLPPDIAETLTVQANEALGGDVSQQRLGIVLEAIAFSPVRPYVALAQIPAEPGKELIDVITKISDRIPEIAKQFGIEPVKRSRGKRRNNKSRPKPPTKETETSEESAQGDTSSIEPVTDSEVESSTTTGSDVDSGQTFTEPEAGAAEDLVSESSKDETSDQGVDEAVRNDDAIKEPPS
tara:strand:+ start:562 stop:2031 length:1470 start_codon:yes stop_codon:yes gene_type:complete